ncbi:MAG: hypothetical protein A2741_01715 [Candidatus Zambryskibacteria bacterium RIFCSPHIGHO2_01_FULL_43_27]|uniref:RNA polymerase subunit sigma-24 n=1 Tax=Candidatus Zambryskibacteria bacterium RIFCSPLOWO2_01_FULL_43_17 TaxID=1802760 RepID=A0A1G2U0R7_9BACT|nr:MAG: hypothetical protein A2741_01715 [Candidatus Zambryskibacteria bacterium RIFCSPHIGHO2_01_FULL_43_27]OHB02999.1 MAG: hypothetical protein A2920_02920 [Candidatus Zambryskibacteria bacterium RIFCSPLOWO2_01_FULL_43_17]
MATYLEVLMTAFVNHDATLQGGMRDFDDSSLVRSYLAGEERAFSELVRRYEKRLQNFVFRATGDTSRAEDLVQETFLRVVRHLHRFDHTKKFSTWIYHIASNLAKNELRNRSRDPVVLFQRLEDNKRDDERQIQFVDPKGDADRLLKLHEHQDLISQAVRVMPVHHKEVFILREMADYTYEDIAVITQAELGTVKSRLNRAREAFKAAIEQMGFDYIEGPL